MTITTKRKPATGVRLPIFLGFGGPFHRLGCFAQDGLHPRLDVRLVNAHIVAAVSLVEVGRN